MKRLLYFLILLTFSCSESTVAPDDQRVGFDYFPLQTGQYAIYDIESITFDILGTIDTSRFQLKVEVVDSFQSLAGDFTYVIHRFHRNTGTDPWEFQAAWTRYRTPHQAVQVEENVAFLKLTFPVEEGKIWDGNRVNTMDTDEYELDSLGVPFVTVTNDTIPNTLTVIQNNNED
ncbi:MAG: hypothetical protein R3345_05780, partial [Fulvivirga sp.]|nr:hypothetical protein [Fulvivirga sp.]